ncbi:MAG: cation:proton antiporter [Myxococcales bacterium]|nr:cation:proton antiporter [Myxococcales bacterium]
MIRSVVLLLVTVALMASARSFLPDAEAARSSAGVALGFGFLVIAAIQAGNIFAALKLPRLTGYLLCGLLVGPDVAALLTPGMVSNLRLVNGVAVGLIALSAGSELNLKSLRPRLKSVLMVSFIAVPAAMVGITLLVKLLGGQMPFLTALTATQQWTAALTLGVVLASLSPAVTIAILSETASAGPMSETALGVVVLADILIIVAFTVVHSLGASVFGVTAGAGHLSPAMQLAIEIGGSIAVGSLVALSLAVYYRTVKKHFALVVLAVCVVAAEVGTRLHLDALLVCLTAGLLLENALGVGGATIAKTLAPANLPIFAVFFALAGAGLHVHDLKTLWPLALVMAAGRVASLFLGAQVGARLAATPDIVRRWLPLALVSQAGVSVGLAELLARHFPTWGPGARGLILAIVTVNEMVGPVLLRFGLTRAGEVGKREGEVEHHEH